MCGVYSSLVSAKEDEVGGLYIDPRDPDILLFLPVWDPLPFLVG